MPRVPFLLPDGRIVPLSNLPSPEITARSSLAEGDGRVVVGYAVVSRSTPSIDDVMFDVGRDLIRSGGVVSVRINAGMTVVFADQVDDETVDSVADELAEAARGDLYEVVLELFETNSLSRIAISKDDCDGRIRSAGDARFRLDINFDAAVNEPDWAFG